MKCKKCGKKVDASMTFCGNCGAAVIQKKKSAGKKVASVFLSIILTISLLLSVTFLIIHSGFDKSNLADWIDTLEISELSIPNGQNGETEPLWAIVYENMKNEPSLTNVNKKTVEKLISKQAIKDIAKDVIAEASAYLFDGKYAKGIPVHTVTAIFEQNKSRLEQAFVSSGIVEKGVEYNFDCEEIEKTLEDMYGQTISVEKLADTDSSIASLIRFTLSDAFLLILWLLTALWIGLLVLINRFDLLTLTLYIGISLIVVAGLYFGIICASGIVLSSMTDSIIFAGRQLIIDKMVLSAIIMVLMGILAVVSRSVIKKIIKKKVKG